MIKIEMNNAWSVVRVHIKEQDIKIQEKLIKVVIWSLLSVGKQ